MRDLVAWVAVIVMSLALCAFFPARHFYNEYQAKQIMSDKASVVNALVSYQNKYGDYPYKEKMLKNKVPDRAFIEVRKKINAGKIANKNVLQEAYEIDMPALKKAVKLSNPNRYFMLKDNPYTAFCYKDAKQEDFKLEDKGHKYDFTVPMSKSEIVADGKKMSKVLCSRNAGNNVTLIGGTGDLYLAKVVDSKVYSVDLSQNTGDDIKEVRDITDRYIVTVLKGDKLKVFDIKEVLN